MNRSHTSKFFFFFENTNKNHSCLLTLSSLNVSQILVNQYLSNNWGVGGGILYTCNSLCYFRYLGVQILIPGGYE